MNETIGLLLIIWFGLGVIASAVLYDKLDELDKFGLSRPKGLIPFEVIFFFFFLFPSQMKIVNKTRREFLNKWMKK